MTDILLFMHVLPNRRMNHPRKIIFNPSGGVATPFDHHSQLLSARPQLREWSDSDDHSDNGEHGSTISVVSFIFFP